MNSMNRWLKYVLVGWIGVNSIQGLLVSEESQEPQESQRQESFTVSQKKTVGVSLASNENDPEGKLVYVYAYLVG